MTAKLHNIKTNIITGFLGSGKTTAILNLLAAKPRDERWAVLVNEFGEVGIDGAIINAKYDASSGVFLREVPGGCMCCAAGVPMQIAMNALLKQAKPNRLLIEPTGLGHPKEVLKVLNSAQYRDVLNLQNTLTLVDARQIADSRYTSHDIFNQQLEIADVIVASKCDLYAESDLKQLKQYLISQLPNSSAPVHDVEFGRLALDWLESPSGTDLTDFDFVHHHDHSSNDIEEMPESGVFTVKNEGEGYHSQGWIFDRRIIFDAALLDGFFESLEYTRIKGVLKTTAGTHVINNAEKINISIVATEPADSRLEVITESRSQLDSFADKLDKLLVSITD